MKTQTDLEYWISSTHSESMESGNKSKIQWLMFETCCCHCRLKRIVVQPLINQRAKERYFVFFNPPDIPRDIDDSSQSSFNNHRWCDNKELIVRHSRILDRKHRHHMYCFQTVWAADVEESCANEGMQWESPLRTWTTEWDYPDI